MFRSLFILLLLSFNLFSQNKSYVLAGYIKEKGTGEPLPYASIIVPYKDTYIGTTSNESGFYSIKLEEGQQEIVFSYIGYNNYKLKINLDKDITNNIFLDNSTNRLTEIVVEDDKLEKQLYSLQTSVLELSTKDIVGIPTLFGQRDIIKTMQYFPGVLLNSEGSSELIVRGGSIDQNLILLDGARVYNPSHVVGFYSIFNSDALRDFKLYKGEMPAEYGGVLSSVLDILTKDGNKKDFKGAVSVGLLSSKATLEIPIIEDKSSLLLSARRTYIDLLVKLFSKEARDQQGSFYFYDINIKYNYEINDKNKIYFSTYIGEDIASNNSEKRKSLLQWGNKYFSFRWNHLFNRKLFSNTFFIYSSYSSIMDLTKSINFNNYILSDYSFKQDFQYFYSSSYKLKLGINSTLNTIEPNIDNERAHKTRNGLENALYVSNRFSLGDLSFRIGLRYSNFLVITPGLEVTLDDNGDILNKVNHNSLKLLKTYHSLEPRLFVNYRLNETSSLKLAATMNTQYLHRYTNSALLVNFSIYLPSTVNIKPQRSFQSSLGYFKSFAKQYQLSLEAYFKDMKNLYDVRQGGSIFNYDHIEENLVESKGRSYGLELLLKKLEGHFNGWLSYTLSKTDRVSDKLNGGRRFLANEDRTHNLSLVLKYKLADRWDFSLVWMYITGKPTTFPEAMYKLSGTTLAYASQRNKYRYPDYHRMDIGFNYKLVKDSGNQLELDLSVYNVYANKNAFSILYKINPEKGNDFEATKIYLFTVLPSISLIYKF